MRAELIASPELKKLRLLTQFVCHIHGRGALSQRTPFSIIPLSCTPFFFVMTATREILDQWRNVSQKKYANMCLLHFLPGSCPIQVPQ